MNCERYQNELPDLEDFLHGELSEKRAAEVRSHLSGCSSCAALRDRLERENDLFARFYEETAMEPTGETWEAIRARIELENGAGPNRGGRIVETPAPSRSWGAALGWLWRPAVLRQAAFAGLLVALSVAATLYFTRRGEDRNVAGPGRVPATPQPRPAVSPAPVSTPSADLANSRPAATPHPTGRPAVQREAPRPLTDRELIDQQIAKAEREYRGAIRLLDRAIARRSDSLDPNLIRQYESSLALIDDSIAKSRRALREQPNGVGAGQFLLAAYAKKVELMQDIAMR